MCRRKAFGKGVDHSFTRLEEDPDTPGKQLAEEISL